MTCVACQCGVGILDEDYQSKSCEHCLQVCYCSQRTFDEVGYVISKDGIRVMKVSDMEAGALWVVDRAHFLMSGASTKGILSEE